MPGVISLTLDVSSSWVPPFLLLHLTDTIYRIWPLKILPTQSPTALFRPAGFGKRWPFIPHFVSRKLTLDASVFNEHGQFIGMVADPPE